MASDLPGGGWPDSIRMAQALVSYMDCPHSIRRAIKGEFRLAPTVTTINRMRRAYLAGRDKPATEHFKVHEGYYPADASASMDGANKQFVQALANERAISQTRKALNSHYLTHPHLVNYKWDEAIDSFREAAE